MEINKEYLKNIDQLINMSFAEDIGDGDITTNSIISESQICKGFFKAKADGIISGLKVAELVFRKLDPNLKWENNIKDGDTVSNGIIIAEFSGEYRALLTAERTALNFIQRMSGISTKTFTFVDVLKKYDTQLLDTRKTLPGHRLLDKYAVKMGGGTNHRYGLFDLVMIKDNHIEVAGGITNAVNQVKSKVNSKIKIEVEVETKNLNEVKEALKNNVDIIMLDNMSNEEMKKAVDLINKKTKTEASGSVNLERLKEIAKTGVDFISVGELTHSVNAFDIGMYIEN